VVCYGQKDRVGGRVVRRLKKYKSGFYVSLFVLVFSALIALISGPSIEVFDVVLLLNGLLFVGIALNVRTKHKKEISEKENVPVIYVDDEIDPETYLRICTFRAAAFLTISYAFISYLIQKIFL
jgi:hypothetical protein